MNDDPGGGGGAVEPIRVDGDWWDLGADARGIDRAAQGWRTLGDAAAARADNLVDGTRELLASTWVGEARRSFGDHLHRLVGDLDLVQAQTDLVAVRLDWLAGLVTTYQAALDRVRAELMRTVPSRLDGDELVFTPTNLAQAEAVRAAVGEAGTIRTEFENALAADPRPFHTDEWAAISARWESIVAIPPSGSVTPDPFLLPPEIDEVSVVWLGKTAQVNASPSVLWVDGAVVVNTGNRDDRVTVAVDADTGEILVDVDAIFGGHVHNGVTYRYPPGTPITVRGGEGYDVLEVAPGVQVNVVLLGGDGSDRIRGAGGGETGLGGHGDDDMFGGDGNDYLSGGSGVDYLEGQGGADRIAGGHGDDTLYGMAADDDLSGGEGADYLEGGKGNDTLGGGGGRDALSGGQGNDTIRGGGDGDVAYAGHGRDAIDGGTGGDVAYQQAEDRATNAIGVTVEVTSDAGFIRIEGSPEFVERVNADLDMYRSSPTGQQMLAALQDLRDPNRWPGEHSLTIRELTDDENAYAHGGEPGRFGNRDSAVDYNPVFTFDDKQGRPATVLYHELAHIYGDWNGNANDDQIPFGRPDAGFRNNERQATGLPYDHDGDPRTPDQIDPEQPLQYTENGLRAELGLPRQDTYG
jgi:hypothetical protein